MNIDIDSENEYGTLIHLGTPERVGHRARWGDTSVPLGTPERVGHRAMCQEQEVNNLDESDASSSGEPDLTDSSADDETVVPRGRVRQTVTGIEKFR